ncbi:cytochrome c oxidase assembly protein [Arthrobacter cheniae]|uniref:cytochrome c oxidase assembly protein n=1 Tax=Arthrobacter cheniae TaxID=1258888 RepID=UPI001F46779B|nr:cytochrome c oxidase assembly protein [Arthrobacter cheniae]
MAHSCSSSARGPGGPVKHHDTAVSGWVLFEVVAALTLVHTHIFVAGYFLTASLIGADPNRHRASIVVRSAGLVVFMTAHSVLIRWLYAHPPTGVEAADAETGAQLMYFGGNVVDITLIILLLAGWHRSTRPRESP